MNHPITFPKVIKIISDFKIVINSGLNDGVKIGDKFIILQVDNEPIYDPDTGESLGFLEIIKGRGKVIHAQDKISTIESTLFSPASKIIRKNMSTNALRVIYGNQEIVEETEPQMLPFEDIHILDYAKPI